MTDKKPVSNEPKGKAGRKVVQDTESGDVTLPSRQDSADADVAGSDESTVEDAAMVGRAIEKMARNPDQRGFISEIMAMSGPMPNPLHQKMTGEHITQTLDLAHKHDEREYNLRDRRLGIHASSRWFRLAIFVISVVAFLVLVIVFKDKADVLIPLLTGLGGLVSGFAAGWGYGKRGSDD